MVAPIILVDPVLTLGALLGPNKTCPLEQFLVFRQNVFVYLFQFLLSLDFIASVFHMVDHLALKAVLNSALAAEEVGLLLVVSDEHVVAAIRHALHHVGVAVPYFFPLKLLTPLKFLRRE